MRGSASTAVLIYFACTSGGLAYLLMAYGAKVMDAKRRPGAQEWAHFLRLMARSDAAMFIVVNWVFAAISMAMFLTTVLFLGRLSSRESGLLLDRLVKYCVFKLMFVSALRLPPTLDETCEWVAWFAVAGFMRIFIGMARDRLELLAAAPSAPLTAHIRAVSLVLIILARDAAAIRDLWGSAPTSVADALGIGGVHEFTTALGLSTAMAAAVAAGAGDTAGMMAAASGGKGGSVSRFVLCAYDLAVVMLEGVKTLVKYGVHCWDSWAARRAAAELLDTPDAAINLVPLSARWEGKGSLLYHVELVADLVTHMMTILHYLHMWCLHGFTLHLVDMVLLMDVRAVGASLYRRIRMYCEYRTATYRLHHAFPDAHPSDDDPCSICMEGMQVAKQLPCGHHFHLACLRAWLQQSGAHTFTCPNCRQPLLIAPPSAPRQPTILDRARAHLHRQSTLFMLQIMRLLLEADQSVLQHQLRRRLRHRQEAVASSRRRQGGRSVPAHEEPEGSGESSHPAPVSCLRKLARRIMGWGRVRGDVGGMGGGGMWRWWRRRWWRVGGRQQQEGEEGGRQGGGREEEEGGQQGLRQWRVQHGRGGVAGREQPWHEELGQGVGGEDRGREDRHNEEEEEEEEPQEGGTGHEVPDPPAWGYWSDEEEETEGDEGEEEEGEEEEEEGDGEYMARGVPGEDVTTGTWEGHAYGEGDVHAGPSQPPLLVTHKRVTARHHASHGTGRGHGTGQDASGHAHQPSNSLHQHQHQHLGERPDQDVCEVQGGGCTSVPGGGGGVETGFQARQARRARAALRRMAGPGQDVPLWSAGAVQQVVAQVARSVRSSLAHGDSRAAIAGAWAPDGEEVCSGWVRQHAHEPATAAGIVARDESHRGVRTRQR